MTTRIELTGRNVSHWIAKHGFNASGHFLAAKVADVTDLYQTRVGELGVAFRTDESLQGGIAKKVIFDCREVKMLQGHEHRKTREVHVDKEGYGIQNLGKGVDLIVSTDAFKRQRR